jgi:hypothetical protein
LSELKSLQEIEINFERAKKDLLYFVETVCGHELQPYQKDMIAWLEKYPKAKIVFDRRRIR